MVKGISQKKKRARQAKPDESPVLGGPKRTPDEILRDRAEIARMRLTGMSQDEIAIELSKLRDYSLSRTTIANELKAVREEWLRCSIDNYDNLRLIELARLDQEERVAWEAWHRSTQPKVRTETGTVGDNPIDKTIEETRDGNPAFLARLESIRQRRCSLLGFTAHQSHEDVNVAILRLLREKYVITPPIGDSDTEGDSIDA